MLKQQPLLPRPCSASGWKDSIKNIFSGPDASQELNKTHNAADELGFVQP